MFPKGGLLTEPNRIYAAELPRISWCSFVKKPENSTGPKILRGYFRARNSFEKSVLKNLKRSVQRPKLFGIVPQ